jgi:hypothetical protein
MRSHHHQGAAALESMRAELARAGLTLLPLAGGSFVVTRWTPEEKRSDLEQLRAALGAVGFAVHELVDGTIAVTRLDCTEKAASLLGVRALFPRVAGSRR